MDYEFYGELLKEAKPAVIDSPEEHDRLLTIAENMMERGAQLREEERKLLELIVFLIQDFEQSVLKEESDADEEDEEDDDGKVEPPEPHITLSRLIETRGLTAADIADIFGNPYQTQLVLDGKKPISRGQAKALARYFKVPDRLFRTQH